MDTDLPVPHQHLQVLYGPEALVSEREAGLVTQVHQPVHLAPLIVQDVVERRVHGADEVGFVLLPVHGIKCSCSKVQRTQVEVRIPDIPKCSAWRTCMLTPKHWNLVFHTYIS